MGDRAVIVAHDTTKQNQDKRIGIYLHWCGFEDCIKQFLQTAKDKEIRGVDSDPQYCWARLTQIIADYISEGGDDERSVGIGIVNHLDCNNGDNGVYYIDGNFNIVKHTDGSELE